MMWPAWSKAKPSMTSVRQVPPVRLFRSKSSQSPSRCIAAPRPAGPAPMMTVASPTVFLLRLRTPDVRVRSIRAGSPPVARRLGRQRAHPRWDQRDHEAIAVAVHEPALQQPRRRPLLLEVHQILVAPDLAVRMVIEIDP